MNINKIKRIKCSANYSFFFSYINKDYLLLINNEFVSIFSILKNDVISYYNFAKSLNVSKFIITSCEFSHTTLTLVISCSNMHIYTVKITELVENCILVNDFAYSDKKCIKQLGYDESERIITSMQIFTNNKEELLVFTDSMNDIKKYSLTKDVILPICSNSNFDKIDNKNFEKLPRNLLTWYNKIISIVPINEELLLANTDYNIIPIQLNKEIPKISSINRDISNRNKASSSVFLIKDYHNQILDHMNRNNQIKNDFNLSRSEQNSKYNEKSENITTNVNNNFSIITKFKTNIFMKYFDDLLFIVEVDWENILIQFTNPIVKKRFKN